MKNQFTHGTVTDRKCYTGAHAKVGLFRSRLPCDDIAAGVSIKCGVFLGLWVRDGAVFRVSCPGHKHLGRCALICFSILKLPAHGNKTSSMIYDMKKNAVIRVENSVEFLWGDS